MSYVVNLSGCAELKFYLFKRPSLLRYTTTTDQKEAIGA